MAKADALSAHQSAVQAADAALYDQGFTDGVASVPPPDANEQQKIDAAVAAKAAEDQAKLDDLSAKLSAVQADDDAQKQLVAAKQSVIDQIKALLA